MSDPLTPDDLERMRAKAYQRSKHHSEDAGFAGHCGACGESWPCSAVDWATDMVRLLDEVERLRGERDSYKLTVDSWIEAASVLPPSQQTYGAIGRIVRDGTP